jgi:hypothetical protein
VIALCLVAHPFVLRAAGEEAAEPAVEHGEVLVPIQTGPDAVAPRVGLDDLLRLPDSYEAEVQRRGGATASQWQSRFEAQRKALGEARERLVELDKELDKISGSSSAWQVSAPGGSDLQTSPLNLRLRQDVKDQREKIEQAERALRELHVQADLAAVPSEWRE